jgi:hypothetical protein
MAQLVLMQEVYCVLSEVPIPNIQGCDRRICQATSVSIVQAEGTGRSAGTECTTGPCASGGDDTAEIFGVRIHGIPERQDGIASIPTVRESGATVLGTSLMGERILCDYNRIGRREDTQIRTVVREAGKAS